MRQPQTYTSWLVTCSSPEKSQQLRDWLSGCVNLDRVLTDTVRVISNGVEQQHVEPHRLGDYFANIHLLPSPVDIPTSFRLVFQRRSDAGRFWKDLMVSILQEIEKKLEGTSITLDYKGDEEPLTIMGPIPKKG